MTEEHKTEHKMHGKKHAHKAKALYLLLAALVAVSLANLAIISNANAKIADDIRLKAEESRPANISITRLEVPGCNDCFDTDDAVASLEQLNVQITGDRVVGVSSDEGQQLAKTYGIFKAPTLLIQGETEKPSVKAALAQLGEMKGGNTIVYAKIAPVYLDIKSGRMVGRLNATIIMDPACGECPNLLAVLNQIKGSGAVVEQERTLELQDTEAQALVKKYNITLIPALMLSSDIYAYENLAQALLQIGSFERDGSYVMRTAGPPFRNISTNKTEGLVKMINLLDETCRECYNASTNRQILENGYGVFIASEASYDVNSTAGRELLGKYSINAVPTFVLSPDAKSYAGLMQAWDSVGTSEKDGWLVFRNINAIQGAVYKNLTANKTGGI